MPAKSQAQFRFMKAVEGGYIKKPGLSKEKAAEYTSENKNVKDLPEKFKKLKKMWSGGKGVKLGDVNTAIFWYRPAGSQTYHVIYGDLSIKDAAEADLPRPIDKQ